MISLFNFSSPEFHFLFYFFSVSQMAADVFENINLEFSANINILLTDKYSISILHLTKCLIAIMLTPFLKVYSTKETYLKPKKESCEVA